MRDIKPAMFNWIDERLRKDMVAQNAIKTKNARLLLESAARVCIGIREKGGNNRGPEVELMQGTIGRAEREPWCMSFAQTLIAYVERKLGIKSPIFPTEHCLTCWDRTPKAQRVQLFPAAGAIPIWRFGTSQSGHTGIMLTADAKNGTMDCIEGNTESGVAGGTVVRDGGGVYFTRRSMTGTGNMKVVGWLKPF